MTNPAKKNTSEGSPRKTAELSESDCQPKPPKRARTSSTDTGLPQPDRVITANFPPATGPVPPTATGMRRISPRRDYGDRTLAVSVARGILQTSDSGTEITSTTDQGDVLDWSYTPLTAMAVTSSTREGGYSPVSSYHGTCTRVITKSEEEKQKTKNTSNILKLDWVWSKEETSDACVNVLGSSGAQVFFHQDYSCGTAAARGTQPMSEGQHFWEIQMDSPVYGTAMMLGVGTQQIDLSQYAHTFCNMLGSDTNSESCGLSYTGRFYQGGANGKAFCGKFGQGTVIGLHLDMWFGTLTYYKNGKCLGIATKGLLGKVWYPMISSTAARSSMCLQTARSFPSSLQFWCCRTLRRAVPTEHSVLEVLELPPGMHAFLEDNLLWLLDSHSREDVDVVTKSTQTDLSMATHQLSEVPLIRRPAPAPDAGAVNSAVSPS